MPDKLNLGKSLIKQRLKQNNRKPLHPEEYVKNSDWSKLPVRSITDETTLDTFFHIAQLSNTDFHALDKSELEGVLITAQKLEAEKLHSQLDKYLKIPRRPPWTKEMTPDELHTLENQSFAEWRSNIAEISERDDVVITPYEKNLDFWRELWRVVERSNVLVQIVDARRPLLFYSKDLDAYVKEHSTPKTCILLINKSDLLSLEQRNIWASYFNSRNIRAIFWSALNQKSSLINNEKTTKLSTTDNKIDRETSHDSDSTLEEEDLHKSNKKSSKEPLILFNNPELFDKEKLMFALKSLDIHSRPENHPFTVGFIGYPNVGKSSSLNALIGSKKVSVSATPGHTKRLQTIYLESNLMLCDCPGLVLPSFAYTRADLVVSGILPVDENRDFVGPINIVCQQIPRSVLESAYGVMIKHPQPQEDPNRVPTAYELLGAVAFMRGFMTSKGVPNFDRAARIILKDYISGRLLFCHPPPDYTDDFMKLSSLQGNASYAPSYVEKISRENKSKIIESISDKDQIISDFDQLNLKLDPMSKHSIGAFRSKRHIPDALNHSDFSKTKGENDDLESCNTWSTVDSRATSSVGGTSLLSGVGYSAYRSVLLKGQQDFESVTSKQAWRRASEAKKFYYPIVPGQESSQKGTARPRKRKEKLRKVYANLDETENF